MIPKHTPEKLARLAKQRQKIREEKALLHLAEERQKLSRVLWKAPLVELEKPYQRGWYREFELTEAAKRRKDGDLLEELLGWVNSIDVCRLGKFLHYDEKVGRRVPKPHRLRGYSIPELMRTKFPEHLYRFLRHEGAYRPLSVKWLEECSYRYSGKFIVRFPEYFVSVTKPLIITQQRVDLPAVRSRIDAIENHFERTNGWGRFRNLRGQSWRWYDYTTSFWRRREQQELKEMREGTRDVVPFCLVVLKRAGMPSLRGCAGSEGIPALKLVLVC